MNSEGEGVEKEEVFMALRTEVKGRDGVTAWVRLFFSFFFLKGQNFKRLTSTLVPTERCV